MRSRKTLPLKFLNYNTLMDSLLTESAAAAVAGAPAGA